MDLTLFCSKLFPCQKIDRITSLVFSSFQVLYCCVLLKTKEKDLVISERGEKCQELADDLVQTTIPLVTKRNEMIGSLDLFDQKLRVFTEKEKQMLREYGRLLVCELEHVIESNTKQEIETLEGSNQNQEELFVENSAQRYKSLFEQNRDAIFSIDILGVFTSVNPAVEKMIGYSPNELIGIPFYAIMDDQRVKTIMEYFAYTMNGETQEFDTNIRHKAGNFVMLRVKTSPIFENDRITGAFVVAKDITDQVRQEQKLKQTMLELADMKLALDESSLVSITNEHAVFTYVNDNFCKVSKYTREELLGQHYSIVDTEEYSPNFFQKVDNLISRGIVWKGEIQNRAKDGSIFWTETTIVPFLNEEKYPYQYVSVKQDITARKLAEDKLLHELELAKKVQRSVLTAPLHNTAISIEARYQPSEQLSGDMYSWYAIDEHRYGVIILDVMGHGVSASLVIMSIRALLRGLITRAIDPVLVMQELNSHMHNLFKDEDQPMVTFVTGLYAVIDTKHQRIEYVNAGHPTGYLNQGKELLQLDVGNIPLGVLEDFPFQKGKLTYQKPCDILLYTDGLLAAYGTSPFSSREKLERTFALSQKENHQSLFDRLLDSETNESMTKDDICLVLVRIPGEKL